MSFVVLKWLLDLQWYWLVFPSISSLTSSESLSCFAAPQPAALFFCCAGDHLRNCIACVGGEETELLVLAVLLAEQLDFFSETCWGIDR